MARDWSDLDAKIQPMVNSGVPIRRIADAYNIPYSTVQSRYCKSTTLTFNCRFCGAKTQEKNFAVWIAEIIILHVKDAKTNGVILTGLPMAIPLKEFRDAATRWRRYTGLDLLQYTDKLLTYAFGYIVFDMAKYLDYCNDNGLQEEESIEEFNERFYAHGRRVNAIIMRMIQ